MKPETESIPRPSWTSLPQDGCSRAQGKVLLRSAELTIALLKFEPNGTIHEHPADIEIDVICLEGQGMTSINGKSAPPQANRKTRWPAGHSHRLWTEESQMTTLMVEHTKLQQIRGTTRLEVWSAERLNQWSDPVVEITNQINPRICCSSKGRHN